MKFGFMTPSNDILKSSGGYDQYRSARTLSMVKGGVNLGCARFDPTQSNPTPDPLDQPASILPQPRPGRIFAMCIVFEHYGRDMVLIGSRIGMSSTSGQTSSSCSFSGR